MSRGNNLVKQRIIILFMIFIGALVFLFGRLTWVQVGQTESLRHLATEQRMRMLEIEPKRGVIYDRLGRELAISAGAETVVALPPEIENPEKTARELARFLNLSYEEILRRITMPRAAIYLERKIEDDRVFAIRDLELPGVTFIEESKRHYPHGELASHVLGFAGVDSQGLEGIEFAVDEYLRGQPGRMATEKDARGREIPQGMQRYIPPQDGNDLYLTIDQVLQYIAERELERALAEHEARGGSILVMDPNLGEILAMANYPNYDPNNFQEFSSASWRNVAISDSYEPGSAFKIITMASAIDEGVVNIEDRFFDPGYIKIGGETINCWKAGGHGSINFKEVVEGSCNPGFVQVGLRLGQDAFYDYIQAFNFGSRLGIEVPGEAQGIMYDYDDLGPVELATMTFGHGIAVTPLQMVSATAAVANGGALVQPRLVREIRDSEGDLVESFGPRILRQVISEETAEITRALLAGVVDSGTGAQAQVEGYEIGGKTGTAKHYGREAYDASFVGILPIDNPQLVILVVLYEVTSYPYYGGQVAAPVFSSFAEDAIRYLELKPTVPQDIPQVEAKTEKLEVPDLINETPDKALEKLREQGFNVRLEGIGHRVVDQIPKPGAEVPEGTTVILFFAETIEEMSRYYSLVPDVTGLNYREAEETLKDMGFEISIQGSGTVRDQNPDGGEYLPQGAEIELFLR